MSLRSPAGPVTDKKRFERLKSGEIGLSIEDGKRIMTTLRSLL